MDLPQDLLSLNEVSAVLGGRISTHSVRRWIARGVGRPRAKLPARRLGAKYYVSRADLNEFLVVINSDDSRFHRNSAKSKRAEAAKQKLQAAGA